MNMRFQFSNILIFFLLFLFCENCYYNPIVNSLLNPAESEENNSFLGLLGLSGQPLLITGQIRDANGVAESGLVLLLGKTYAPQSKSITSGMITDAGGRFYIPYQTGSISFTVYRNDLYYFEFTLEVASPTEITASKYGAPPTLEITGLGTVNPSEVGNFFELVGAYYLNISNQEIILDKTNQYSTIGSLVLKFNESPAFVETNDLAWIQNAIIISPSISTIPQGVGIVGNNIILAGAEGFVNNNKYDINFSSNIKSSTGLSLTPRRIQFCYEPAVPCTF